MKPLSLALTPDFEFNNGLSVPINLERRLRQVIEIIDSEPGSSVRDLALKVSLSSAHLQRLFKRQTGIQLGFFIAESRLQKAAELLKSTDLPIKEVAHRVGYQHPSSFVRAFERRFTEAPRRFRNEQDSPGDQPYAPDVTKG
jgi:transcriptional regulator GlxA family with amidase domain